jgi:hypothetical protein
MHLAESRSQVCGTALTAFCTGPVDPTYACIPTGINRCMHEFKNRPTAGSSDCPGCARRPPVARRTREASTGWPSNGKALLRGLWPMMAEGCQRPTSSILAAIAQRRACAAYDGRGALSRCGYSSAHGLRPPLRLWPRLSVKRNNRWRSRGGSGGSGGSGVGDLRRAFASSLDAALAFTPPLAHA